MYKHRPLCKAVSFSALAIFSSSSLAADEKTSNSSHAMENIIVIGEKTERSLKDTTSSVSVIAEDALKNLQHLTVSDAVSNISNVVVLSGAVPDIRGVSGNGAASGFASFSGGAKARVTTLVDGVIQPFIADLTGDSGIWDVEQIEVYRGPQSTSNGRNSIGGSVYIKTKDPSFDWQGAARVGLRNKDNYVDTSAMLSGPIVDNTLAFRITAQQLNGDTLSNGEEYEGNPASFDLNSLETQKLKGKLLWTPTEDFKALFSVSSDSEEGNTGRIYYTLTNVSDYRPIFYRYLNTDADTASLKLSYQLNTDMSVEILAAYMDYQWGFDSYEADVLREQYVRMNENNASLDAKLSFGEASEVFNGFIGLAYFNRSQDFNSTGGTIYVGDDKSTSTAIYGEVTYALSDALSLITGTRIEREKQKRYFNFNNDKLIATLDPNETTKTFTLPKIALQYALTENTTVSASARRGYNAAGGALNFAAGEYYYYDDETVNTYELSLRSSLAGGNVNLNANLFYNDYSGYQAFSSSRVITNMENVKTHGVEIEAIAMITPQMELSAGLGLLESEITDAGENYPDADGNELNSSPSLTASLSTRYWFSDELSIALSANYVDDYFGDFTNTNERVAGGYTLARLNVNYELENWLIAGFINNAFDENALITREPAGGRYPDGYAAIVDPRNVGLSVTYSF